MKNSIKLEENDLKNIFALFDCVDQISREIQFSNPSISARVKSLAISGKNKIREYLDKETPNELDEVGTIATQYSLVLKQPKSEFGLEYRWKEPKPEWEYDVDPEFMQQVGENTYIMAEVFKETYCRVMGLDPTKALQNETKRLKNLASIYKVLDESD